jgi:hypothetical protein
MYKNKEDKLACQRRCYARNPEKYILDSKKQVIKKREWFQSIKSGFCCKICGDNRPPVLDFHHRDSAGKDFTVSQMVNRFSRKRILEEIEKCDILCANCHRILHFDK